MWTPARERIHVEVRGQHSNLFTIVCSYSSVRTSFNSKAHDDFVQNCGCKRARSIPVHGACGCLLNAGCRPCTCWPTWQRALPSTRTWWYPSCVSLKGFRVHRWRTTGRRGRIGRTGEGQGKGGGVHGPLDAEENKASRGREGEREEEERGGEEDIEGERGVTSRVAMRGRVLRRKRRERKGRVARRNLGRVVELEQILPRAMV